MNLVKINLFLVTSFFPVFVVRSNLSSLEIFYTIMIFILPTLFFGNFFLIKIKNKKILIFFLALIFTFGLDNNLGFWNGIIQPLRYEILKYFKVIYYPALFLIIGIFFVIYFLLMIGNKKIQNFLLIFLITIFIFNVFDKTKSHLNIVNFDNQNNKNHSATELIMIFDEMSGLNSEASKTKEGIEFNKNLINFYKKYNFNYYKDTRSITDNTGNSISTILNLTKNINIRNQVLKPSSNYFQEYELTSNLLFDKFQNISVFQNIHINFCKFSKVSKCNTYSPFVVYDYLKNFNDSFLSKFISIWKINGSISSTFIWRTLRQFNIIDSTLEPEGEKASINDTFSKIEKDIFSKKFDLVFAHILVPHTPYGFKEDCSYEGELSINNIFYTNDQKFLQHNIERNCVVKFLDKLLTNIANNKNLDELKITILSDHGSRITRNEESRLSTIYGYRDKKTQFKEIDITTSINDVFIKKYN